MHLTSHFRTSAHPPTAKIPAPDSVEAITLVSVETVPLLSVEAELLP